MSIRVYRHAVIHTGDHRSPRAEAVAVQDGRVLAVGPEVDVRTVAGARAELVDLDGAAVMPGLYHAHIHTALYAHSLTTVDLAGTRSLAEALTRIADHAARLRPGQWLLGGRSGKVAGARHHQRPRYRRRGLPRGVPGDGVTLAFGSDAPVEDPNPFPALHAAVTRTRPDGTPAGGWQPEQRISMAEAIRAHTLGAAYAAGEDARKGILAPGMLADFIAVNTDPYREPPKAVLGTRVLTTVVGGEVRWQTS